MEKLSVYKKYFETASDDAHLVMHRGYALALVKMVEELQEYSSQLEHENQLLYGRLNMIRDLTEKEIK